MLLVSYLPLPKTLANTSFNCVQGVCCLGKQDFEELRREEMDKFNELYIEWKGLDNAEKDSSYKKIPKFFRKVFIYLLIRISFLRMVGLCLSYESEFLLYEMLFAASSGGQLFASEITRRVSVRHFMVLL